MSHSQLSKLQIALFSTVATAVGAPSAYAAGSVSLTAIGNQYGQDFNSLASTGSSSSTPDGWALLESGTSSANNGSYNAGTGSSNAGDTYSFGAAGSSERAFGGLLSGTLTPIIGASFTNNTGQTINALSISYTGEQWRLGTSGRTDRLDFQYSTDANGLGNSNGTWIHVDALDFNGPVSTGTVGALNGNANKSGVAAIITGLSIAPGATFWIRWTDFNASGADDGLAVDDFFLTPANDAPPAVTDVAPADGALNVALDADVVLDFSEPVYADETSFSIDCAVSGNHPYAVSASADLMTYTLDPVDDFAIAEECTVTVLASGISDTDVIDPPDGLSVNFVTSFESDDGQVCGDPATFIHEIQGSGASAAKTGTVTVEGIVVGDYQASGEFGGYHLQEEDGDADADPATSEGIFVFSTLYPVQVGDKVRVKGTVTEFSNLTEINNVSKVLICGHGLGASVTPTPVSMPVASLGDWERYEGMLVSFAQDLTVTETFTLSRFGEVTLSGNGRLYNPTAVVSPGAPAIARQAENDRDRIVLDDGNNQQNIDPTRVPPGGLSASNTVRSGYTVHGLTGVLEERFGVYRLQPVGPVAFDDSSNPRQSSPDPVDGIIQVASMNLLNYFNGNGLGGGFNDPNTQRGAETLFEFERQRAKAIAAILAVDADIYGFLEVENDATDGHGAIEDLVAGLNEAMGPGSYAFIDTGPMGGDLIRSAIVYRPESVTPIGPWKKLDSTTDGGKYADRWVERGNRPTIAQTFEANASGARFTIAVNHLRSKGSSCDSATSPFNDPDIGDGQGNCNLVRTRAASALVEWLSGDPTGSNDPDFLIVGDMNSYAKEDPITTIVGGGYTDLIAAFIGPEAYSYVFGAQSGYIDHALASGHLVDQVSGVAEFHNNADEPVALDYNVNFKSPNQITTFYAADAFRASDHDPLVVGLQLNDPPSVGAITAPTTPVAVGTTVTASAPFTDGALETHTAVLDWGDGTTSTATVTESGGAGTASGTHVYAAPGIYTIVLTVTDDHGGSGTQSYQYVVVYDPNGAFATGGGTLESPAGALAADPSLVGKASFGFVAKYLKGTTVPVGNAEFHFRAGDLNFHADSYAWMVVSGTTAQLKGTGSVNGEDGYGVLLTAGDGAVDTFRIKIWRTDASGDHVVYDSGSLPIASGSIVVKR